MIFKQKNKAIYLQIADGICDAVINGTFIEGERMASLREYAASIQVNANTLMRTYEYLAQEGVLYNKHGIGYFIAEDAKARIRVMRHEAFFNGEMQEFFRQLSQLGVSPDDLYAYYVKYLEQ